MNKKNNTEEAGMLSKEKILELLHSLDNKLNRKIRLIVGGGAAIILKYGIERRTTDILIKTVDSLAARYYKDQGGEQKKARNSHRGFNV